MGLDRCGLIASVASTRPSVEAYFHHVRRSMQVLAVTALPWLVACGAKLNPNAGDARPFASAVLVNNLSDAGTDASIPCAEGTSQCSGVYRQWCADGQWGNAAGPCDVCDDANWCLNICTPPCEAGFR